MTQAHGIQPRLGKKKESNISIKIWSFNFFLRFVNPTVGLGVVARRTERLSFWFQYREKYYNKNEWCSLQDSLRSEIHKHPLLDVVQRRPAHRCYLSPVEYNPFLQDLDGVIFPVILPFGQQHLLSRDGETERKRIVMHESTTASTDVCKQYSDPKPDSHFLQTGAELFQNNRIPREGRSDIVWKVTTLKKPKWNTRTLYIWYFSTLWKWLTEMT